ncbi:hypothetical protein FRB95_006567 [Tulasnella sp. JGI-2019a]|nr:hypothetical protein FRB95_006567 [Tulasnella sp. JGI-2019a]
MKSCPNLPQEIWIGVVRELGRPSHISAYCLPLGSAIALAHLCLVNRAFNSITEPVLYSRMLITQRSLEGFSKSFAISALRSGYGRSDKGKLVNSLALLVFDDNDPEELESEKVQQIGAIFDAVKSTVTRLFLDTPIDPTRPSLRIGGIHDATVMKTLAGFSAIEELCLTDDATARCDTWLPSWALGFKLKRIALSGCYVANYHLVGMAGMESLETCIMASLTEMEYDSETFALRDVVAGSWTIGRPQELVVVVCEIEDWVTDRFEESCKENIELGQSTERAGSGVFKMRKIEVSEGDGLMAYPAIAQRQRAWFTQSAIDGTIWDKDFQVLWDAYRKKLTGLPE